MSRSLSLFSSLSLAALLAAPILGCASVPVPQDRLTSSEASIRAATEVGAEQEPRAALHLKLAQEQLAQAKELIAKGEHERADIILQKALADSELALGLTKETVAQAEAVAIGKQVKTLRSGG
jgi:hypothetical protein